MTESSDLDRSETVEIPAQTDVLPVAPAPEPQDAGSSPGAAGAPEAAGATDSAKPSGSAASPGWSPGSDGASSSIQDTAASLAASASERPEVMVGAAFAGGLLAALILRRLAR